MISGSSLGGMRMLSRVKSYDKEAEILPLYRVEHVTVPSCYQPKACFPSVCNSEGGSHNPGCSSCPFFDEAPF